jgi:hypothetical protein
VPRVPQRGVRAARAAAVRIESACNLVLDAAGAQSVALTHVVVQCGDEEGAVQLAAVAPRVLLHVRRSGEYVGSAALPLSGEESAGLRGVVECTRDALDKATDGSRVASLARSARPRRWCAQLSRRGAVLADGCVEQSGRSVGRVGSLVCAVVQGQPKALLVRCSYAHTT